MSLVPPHQLTSSKIVSKQIRFNANFLFDGGLHIVRLEFASTNTMVISIDRMDLSFTFMGIHSFVEFGKFPIVVTIIWPHLLNH